MVILCLVFNIEMKKNNTSITRIIATLALSVALFACNAKSQTSNDNKGQKSANQKDALNQKTTDFERNFLAKFPLGNMPLELGTVVKITDTIPATLVITHILEAAENNKIKTFSDYWGDVRINSTTKKGLEDRFLDMKNSVFMVLNFGYGQRLDLDSSYYSVLFQVIPSFLEGGYAYTYLANYSKKGEMLDAVRISANAGYVDMQLLASARIDKDGKITLESKNIKRGGLQDGSADFTEIASLAYKVDKDGKITIEQEKYSGFSGNFEGKETPETLKIEESPRSFEVSYNGTEVPQEKGKSYLQVLYKPSSEMQPDVALEIVKFDKANNTIIAKHPEENLQFVLVYDANKKSIQCKTSTGKTFNLNRKS